VRDKDEAKGARAFVIASKAKQSSGGAAWIASSLSLLAMTRNYFRREIG
jgi:hypothetical protein